MSASINIEIFYLSESWSEIDFGRHFFCFLSPKAQGANLTQSPGHVGPSPLTFISNSTSFLCNVKWHGHLSGGYFKTIRERMRAKLSKRLKAKVEANFFVDSTRIGCDICRQLAGGTFVEVGECSTVCHHPGSQEEEFFAYQALIVCPVGSFVTMMKNPFVTPNMVKRW
ncbi:ferredoxin [Nitrospira sp. T9]|uniref:ferredoxin n=1 Tax=Nitrospira sp. T9 TaxID=3456077 RepID=UPI003F9B1D15